MKVNILGAGTWGTALAYVLHKNNINVSVWGRNKEKIAQIHSTRKHPNLDNFIIPDNILYTSEFPDLKSDIIVLATSTKFIGEFINKLPPNYLPKIVIACKGFYKLGEKFLLPTETFNSFLNFKSNLCVLTGPSHAEELIKENATAILAASDNSDFAKEVQKIFSNDFFRVYTSKQVLVSQIGGAVKNIIAIASGICDGLNLGDNTKAALVSRGMSEIIEYSKTVCGEGKSFDFETLYGLSGLGDLIATAYSEHSRNRKFGELIGLGLSAKDSLLEIDMTVEGFDSSSAIKKHSEENSINMPICSEVYEILHNNKDPKISLYSLMTRKLTDEN